VCRCAIMCLLATRLVWSAIFATYVMAPEKGDR
jgi:hypothetical protein